LIPKPAAVSARSSALMGLGQRISGQHQGQRILFSAHQAEDMTAPTTGAVLKKALDQRAVAVGTEITLRPPHRSRRALLTHRAPTLDGDEEPLLWPRMQDAREWQVPVCDRLHSGPR
jgi:hypothetical protein